MKTDPKHVHTLAIAFSLFPTDAQTRLLHHVAENTPIACGPEDFDLAVNEAGFG